jgi:hypothetical protein
MIRFLLTCSLLCVLALTVDSSVVFRGADATILISGSSSREVAIAARALSRDLRSSAPAGSAPSIVASALPGGCVADGHAVIIVASSADEALSVLRAAASAAAPACSAASSDALARAARVAAAAARALTAAATGDAAVDGDAHAVLASDSSASAPVFVLIGGGAPRAALFAAAAFSRTALGAAYTLGSAFVPAAAAAATPAAHWLAAAAARVAAAPVVASPRFAERGLFPWHDFTMGPDWLDKAAWQAYVWSMSTLRFNVLMLHNYNADDHRGYCPQPIVWYGNAADLAPGGVGVTRAYPTWQDSSLNAKDHPAGQGQGWARNATEYDGGAGKIFPFACAASVLQAGRADRCPYPVDHDAAVSTFAEAAAFFNESVWAPARALGIAMAVAVGAPLSVPPPENPEYGSVPASYCAGLPFTYVGNDSPSDCAVRCAGLLCTCFDTGTPPPSSPANAFACRISLLGNATAPSSWNYTAHPVILPPVTPAILQRAYEGMLTRASATYAGGIDTLVLWTQIQSTAQDFAAIAAELPIAQAALTATGNSRARLATGGWRLGPDENVTYLDGVAAANVTLSALLTDEGTMDPDSAFGTLKHASWTIPWLEGDNGLLRPQVYVPRTLAQAELSASYRVRGNLAIHWRVLPCAPAATALSLSAWAPNVTAAQVFSEFVSASFALPARHPALAPLAAAFAVADDSATPGWSDWVTFDLSANIPESDATLNQSYAFIQDTFVPLRPLVAEEPIAARALEYWIASYTAALNMNRHKLRWRDYEAVWASIQAAPMAQRPALAAALGLPALAALSSSYSAVLAALLPAIESFGDIGVVNDINQNSYNQGVAAAAADLGAYISVPPSALPDRSYSGPPHIAAPNVRTLVLAGDDFDIEVWVIDALAPASVQLCVAAAATAASGTAYSCTQLAQVGTGQVYRGAVPPPAPDFNAYVNVTLHSGSGLFLPPAGALQPWLIAVA